MSFGFSIGDFFAVGKLIADITTSLQDAGGAKSDYQELIRELELLGKVLRGLDELQTQDSSTKTLESIKYAALSCQRPLEEFLGKIKGYENALDVRAKRSVFGKSSVRKVRWSLGPKEEATKLQCYLSVHIGTINVLLAEHGLESLRVASRDAEDFHVHVRGTLEGMQRTMGSIEGDLGAQRHAVDTNNSMLTTIYQMVCGDMSTSLNSIMGMASAVCVRTQQIYGILLELKSSFQAPDTRWTWFQDPFKVEDALGSKFPIPAEYNFDLIEVIIKTRFKEGPGSQDVQLGNYELVQGLNSSQAISAETHLRPGTRIIMAIIISKHDDGVGNIACPMPRCGSTQTTPVPCGGRACSQCQVWFGESDRKRKRIEEVVEQETGKRQRLSTGSTSGHCHRSDSKPLERTSLSDEETGAYKNVRCSQPSSTPNKGDLPVSDRNRHEAIMKQMFPNGVDHPKPEEAETSAKGIGKDELYSADQAAGAGPTAKGQLLTPVAPVPDGSPQVESLEEVAKGTAKKQREEEESRLKEARAKRQAFYKKQEDGIRQAIAQNKAIAETKVNTASTSKLPNQQHARKPDPEVIMLD